MKCFMCGSTDLTDVPFETQPPHSQWHRCGACGSDTADISYKPEWYVEGVDAMMIEYSGGIEQCRKQVWSNVNWFDKYRDVSVGNDFLDVGCGDGAMLYEMGAAGWSVHGFDVFKPQYYGSHITVAPIFHRRLFDRQFAAINCREVIEHCPFPEMLLAEMRALCMPGGLIQIQTPQPCNSFDRGVYAEGHLFVAAPEALKTMIRAAGLEILEEWVWGDDRQAGQAYMTRAK